MLIEPLEPLRVLLPDGERDLAPGQTYDLPELQAQKLLAKAPGRVRIAQAAPSQERIAFDLNVNLPPPGHSLDDDETIPPGAKIRFRSPMFGQLEAVAIEARGAVVWVWHPMRECEACIPRHWVEEIIVSESP